MKRLAIAAVGLALVVGIIMGGTVGNLFGATAQRTSAAAVTGSGCYTNWNSADCAAGYTAVSVGEWTAVAMYASGMQVGTVICASPKADVATPANSTYASVSTDQREHTVSHEPCAICCATGSPLAVGGLAELPAVASTGTSGMGGTTYAVLTGAVAGVLAFAVLATLAVRRRGVTGS